MTDIDSIPVLDEKAWESLARRLSALTYLTEGDRETLAGLALHEKSYGGGENIFEEGDDQNAVFLCLGGWGARYRLLPDGLRQVVDLILPGSLFGGTISPYGEYTHSAEALKDMNVALISVDALSTLSDAAPRLACALAMAMGEEGTRLSERVVSLGRRDAFERLAHFFLELRYRLGGSGAMDMEQIRVPIPQQEMADFLGLTSVHVSRTMRKMADRDLIAYDDEYVEIRDVEALAACCDFELERLQASPVPAPIRRALLG